MKGRSVILVVQTVKQGVSGERKEKTRIKERTKRTNGKPFWHASCCTFAALLLKQAGPGSVRLRFAHAAVRAVLGFGSDGSGERA